MISTLIVSHPDCGRHVMAAGHPESPMRLEAVMELFKQSGLLQDVKYFDAKPADLSVIAKTHPESYIQHLQQMTPSHGLYYVDPDTALNPHSLYASQLATGAALDALNQVMAGPSTRAFCVVRPPGHHAEKSLAMGFCFVNSIAVAAHTALDQYGLERVAIVDFDVHHCNGTVDIFKDDPRVMVLSSFQHPHYPYRYFDLKRDHIINSPLAAGATGRDFRHCVERQWLGPLEQHRPELLLVSAGFDAHAHDPLGELMLLEEDYYWVTQQLLAVAARFSQGRLISVLEGGYNLPALASSALAHVQAMLDYRDK